MREKNEYSVGYTSRRSEATNSKFISIISFPDVISNFKLLYSSPGLEKTQLNLNAGRLPSGWITTSDRTYLEPSFSPTKNIYKGVVVMGFSSSW